MQNGMIESKFQTLRWQKAAQENRDITLREIAEQTQLSLGTIHKMSKGTVKGVRIETLDALCRYFAVSSISELIEFKSV
jgi:DNA-binding Xre family transcriptional regulator